MFPELIDATQGRALADAEPSTGIAGGGNIDTPEFARQERDRDRLEQYEAVYQQGGPIASLIDTKATMIFGVGSEFVTDAEDITATVPFADEPVTVAEWLDHVLPHRDTLFVALARDAYVYGDWLTETVETRGGDFDRVTTINPKTMEPRFNDKGTIRRWDQILDRGPMRGETVESFDPDEIGHGALKTLGRNPLGISLVGRAFDQIERFQQNQEAISEALQKHAFRRWHVQVQAQVDDNDLRRIRQRFHQVSEYRELTTGRDIEIEPLDEGGVGESITDITETDLRNVATAIGVPPEFSGLMTSTEALSKTNLQRLEREGRGEQRDMAAQFVREVVRDLLAEYSPFPRDIDLDLVFGDIVSDQQATAEWIRDFKDTFTRDEIRDRLDAGPVPEDADIAGDEAPAAGDDGGQAGGGIFDGGLAEERGTGNRNLAVGEAHDPWEREIDALYARVWEADRDRDLFQFDPEEVPEFVMDNLRAAIDESLFSAFDEIPDAARMAVRETLLDSLEQQHGWSIQSIMDNLDEAIPREVSDAYLETVARSETQHLVSTAAEKNYRERLDMDEAEFRWSGMPFDPDRSTRACQWIEEQIEAAGGGVSMDRLLELIQEAPSHDPDLRDNMARRWSPHPSCTHRPVRVVG